MTKMKISCLMKMQGRAEVCGLYKSDITQHYTLVCNFSSTKHSYLGRPVRSSLCYHAPLIVTNNNFF